MENKSKPVVKQVKRKMNKKLKHLDYNYTNDYKFESGKWHNPIRIRCDLKSSNRDDILIYLKKIGLVDKYTLKLFRKMYSSIAKSYGDLYECYEFQEYLSSIWLEVCNISQEKWDEIWNNSGKVGVTAFVSGIVHRSVISNCSHQYRDIFKYKSKYSNFDDENWRIYEEVNNPDFTDIWNLQWSI